MLQNTAQALVNGLVSVMSDFLYPMLFAAFILTVILKGLVVYNVRRQWWFAKEFEKRVVRYTDKITNPQGKSFYMTCKRLLERTYYELFEVRGIMMRRKLDFVSSPIDRLFAIQQGCAWYVRDTLREIRHLRNRTENPRFLDISKTVNAANPCFGKLFGWIPIGPLNEVLNVIPGLFIIGGIFGTFLGIMEALPQLGQLDLKDPEASKIIMDAFLLKVSFAIRASIIGITFSVALTVYYATLTAEKLYIKVVDIYDRCLTRIWECSEHNDVPANLTAFNEHRDPIEALASLALDKEVAKSKHSDRFAYAPSETSPDDLSDEDKKKAS